MCSGVPDFRERVSLARKTGQIVGRGRRRWLVRVFLGRERETRKRRYHCPTVHGTICHAQMYFNKVLRERDLGRRLEEATITLDEVSLVSWPHSRRAVQFLTARPALSLR